MLRARLTGGALFAVLAMVAFVATAVPQVDAGTGIAFTAVTPAVVAAPADYASDVRGYYWDFANRSRYHVEDTSTGFVGGGRVASGWFTGTTKLVDAKIWLQRFSLPGAVVQPTEGTAKPIDTKKYRYLTIRMCSSKTTDMFVYWFEDIRVPGGAGFERVEAGCGVYTVDLVADRNPGGGSRAWEGSIQTIAIRVASATGIKIDVDYVTLTPDAPGGQDVSVAWTKAAGKFDLYFDSSADPGHPTLIEKGVKATAGQYTWRTGALPPGRYYFVAKRAGDESVSKPFSVNDPPRTTIVSPGFDSGPDYATLNGGAWNMKKATDISRADNVKDVTLKNGVYCATNTNNDPALYLRTPVPIDPSRFSYVTYRLKIFGERDLGLGSVARFLWNNGASSGTTEDLIDYQGWQKVSIDLRTALLTPGSSAWTSGSKVWFRIDPHEIPPARRFCVDFVRLTGNNAASSEHVIKYGLSDPGPGKPSVSFFYTTKAGATSGGTAIACAAPAAAGKCRWNVKNVAKGLYYVYAVARDGRNTAAVPSDTPVAVK